MYSNAASNGPISTFMPLALPLNVHVPVSSLNSNENALVEPGLSEVMSSLGLNIAPLEDLISTPTPPNGTADSFESSRITRMTSSSSSSISIETSVSLALNEPEEEVYSFIIAIPMPTHSEQILQFNANFVKQLVHCLVAVVYHFSLNLVSLGSDQSTAATV